MAEMEYATTTGNTTKDFRKLIIWHTLVSGSTSDGMYGGSISGSWVWLGLYTDNPTLDYSGIYEVSGGNYKRIDISGSFSVNLTTGSSANLKNLVFPTANTDWGTVKYWGISNGSAAGGNSGSLLFYGTVGGYATTSTTSLGRHVGPEETISFTASSLKIKLDGAITEPLGGSLINHYLNNVRLGGSSIRPWLGLYTVTEGQPLSASAELTNTGYKRIITGGSGGWTGSWTSPAVVSGSNKSHNATDFIFTYNAGDEWLVNGAFIISASIGGEIMYRIPFNEQKEVSASGGFMFSASKLEIEII